MPCMRSHKTISAAVHAESSSGKAGESSLRSLWLVCWEISSSPTKCEPPTVRRWSIHWRRRIRPEMPRQRASSFCSCTAAPATLIHLITNRICMEWTARRFPSRRSGGVAKRAKDVWSGRNGSSINTGCRHIQIS